MKPKPSNRQFERLSAYLDGALTAAEAKRLEDELAGNPELRDALADLRQTRHWLRSLPPVRVKRSFTLTPAQAQSLRPQRRSIWVPLMGSASALAVLLIGFTFFLQMVGPLALGAAAPAPVLEADTLLVTELPTPTGVIIVWGAPGIGGGGGGGGEVGGMRGAPTEELEVLIVPTAPELPPVPTQMAAPGYPTSPAADRMAVTPTAMPTTAKVMEDTGTPTPPAPSNGPILGIAPTGEQGRIVSTPIAPAPVQEYPGSITAWGVLRILLLVLALSLAGGAILLARRRSN